MPRFPALLGEKVRPIDDASATGSPANLFSNDRKKLSVPSADFLVSVVRSLATRCSGKKGDGLWTSPVLSGRIEGRPSSRYLNPSQEDWGIS